MASPEELLLPPPRRQRRARVLLGLPCRWTGNAASCSWQASTAATSSRRRKRMPSVELGAGGRRRRRRALVLLRRVRLRVLVIFRALRRAQRRLGYYFSVPAVMPGAVAYIR